MNKNSEVSEFDRQLKEFKDKGEEAKRKSIRANLPPDAKERTKYLRRSAQPTLPQKTPEQYQHTTEEILKRLWQMDHLRIDSDNSPLRSLFRKYRLWDVWDCIRKSYTREFGLFEFGERYIRKQMGCGHSVALDYIRFFVELGWLTLTGKKRLGGTSSPRYMIPHPLPAHERGKIEGLIVKYGFKPQ